MKINGKTGLVLEGGGMRGVFTSGVLDAFMKHDLYFRYIVAVSAGACNGMSYVSRQPRRARISNIDFWPVTSILAYATSSLKAAFSTVSCFMTSFPTNSYHLISMNISNMPRALRWSPPTV